jgi:hypothetical protein
MDGVHAVGDAECVQVHGARVALFCEDVRAIGGECHVRL